MRESMETTASSGAEVVNFRIVASGALDPQEALAFQERVLATFHGGDSLQYTVVLGNGELPTDAVSGADSAEKKQELKEWLDADLRTILPDAGISTRTANCLLREGLKTRRHLFLYGKQNLNDIRNFGSQSMAETMRLIKNEFGMELEDTPGLEYAATISDDISQLPACLYIDTNYRRGSLDWGRDTISSLADLLQMPLDTIEDKFVSKRDTRVFVDGRYVENPYTPQEEAEHRERAQDYKNRAEELAARFTELKQSH